MFCPIKITITNALIDGKLPSTAESIQYVWLISCQRSALFVSPYSLPLPLTRSDVLQVWSFCFDIHHSIGVLQDTRWPIRKSSVPRHGWAVLRIPQYKCMHRLLHLIGPPRRNPVSRSSGFQPSTWEKFCHIATSHACDWSTTALGGLALWVF